MTLGVDDCSVYSVESTGYTPLVNELRDIAELSEAQALIIRGRQGHDTSFEVQVAEGFNGHRIRRRTLCRI